MSNNLKLLTIREAESADDSQLFLLNRMKPVGNVNITVTTENGERRTVVLPVASCPVDATTQATKTSVLSNPDFRRIYAKGGVKIVDTDSAEQLFKNNPKAQEELNRIFDIIDDNSSDLGSPTISDVAQDSTITSVSDTDTVSPFIMNLVNRSEQESAEALISEMRSRLDQLADDELQYVVTQSSSAKLKEWAADELALRDMQEDQDNS